MSEHVRYRDIETGASATIPARELTNGMVPTQTVGPDGCFGPVEWIEADKLVDNTEPRHPPLTTLRPIFDWFSRLFAAGYPKTPKEWEEGFRHDVNYTTEVLVWCQMAEVYARLTAGRPANPARDRELFALLLNCMNAGPETALVMTPRVALMKGAARKAVAMMVRHHDLDLKAAHDVYADWKDANPGRYPAGALNAAMLPHLERFAAKLPA
jgi:hypothetical protein